MTSPRISSAKQRAEAVRNTESLASSLTLRQPPTPAVESFSASSWLTALGLHTEVGRMLLNGQAPSRDRDRELLLQLSGSVSSEEELAAKLRDGRLASKVAALVFPALQVCIDMVTCA